MTFFGKYRGDAHPHESPLVMTVPLAALAFLSLAGGYINIPHYLEPLFGHPHAEHEFLPVAISVAAGVIGILLAWFLYVVKPELPGVLAEKFGGFYRLVYNKFYVDEAYDSLVVSPTLDGSNSVLWRGVDVRVIDGAVNGAGTVARGIGGALRHMQSGYIRRYAAWVLTGALLLIAASLMGGLR
jgi:NADH-quinone oxidoreductase subunit L